MADLLELGNAIGGAAVAVSTYVRGRQTGTRKSAKQLRECEQRSDELQDRISALETALSAMRNLMPGGSWWRRLGLDKHPFENDDQEKTP